MPSPAFERENHVGADVPDCGTTFGPSMVDLLRSAPIPDDRLLQSLGLFLESRNLARLLFLDFLFRQIVSVEGAILEFGTGWGQNLATFAALRGIYDPFNRHRKIIGFGDAPSPESGALPQDYPDFLASVLGRHEAQAPLAHLKKFELRRGDPTAELEVYLRDAPETIVALAYFDLSLYGPTCECLERLRPRLVRGSVLGFDEFGDTRSAGETLALMDVFGLDHVRLQRLPQVPHASYFVVE